MRTAYHTYMEAVFNLARRYQDVEITYDSAMCGCREIAGEFERPWEGVAEDFEVACDEVLLALDKPI